MRTIMLAIGAMFLVIGAVAYLIPASESYTIQEPQTYTHTEDNLIIQMVLDQSEVYSSNISAADNRLGFWLDLDLFARAPTRVRIYGDGTPPIFDAEDWGFAAKIPLINSTKWYVEITAGEFGGPTAVSGNIYVRHFMTTLIPVLKSRTVYPYRNFGVGSIYFGVGGISVGIFWIAGEYFLNRKKPALLIAKVAKFTNRLHQLSLDLRQLCFSLLECSIARIARLGKLKRTAIKFALVLFLLVANVAVAPFSCYITAERHLEVVLYRSIGYPTGAEEDRAVAELYPLFVSMYPNKDVYVGHQRDNHFVIFMYDQPRILSPTLIVIVLMLNTMCILTIAYPTKILCSEESVYYTKQIRKTLFYGIDGMYYYDSVMKQWLRERN